MPAALYDGFAIFGPAHRVVVADNPTAAQVAAFFGVSGQVSLFGGIRGRVFEVTGVLTGADVYGLASAEQTFRSYLDGIGRVLTDTKGVSWDQVVLRRYAPDGPWRWLAGGSGACQPYRALFEGML